MIACKAFEPGLICRGYQFVMGLNVTDKANCRANGFHCAENPLDCLNYYPEMDKAEYYLVDAHGDLNEDGNDAKIACTELTIIKMLTQLDFFLYSLAYMVMTIPFAALKAQNGMKPFCSLWALCCCKIYLRCR